MMKCAQNSFVCIAFIKRASNKRLILDIEFVASVQLIQFSWLAGMDGRDEKGKGKNEKKIDG